MNEVGAETIGRLRKAYDKGGHLPEHERRTLLKYWLAYQCRGMGARQRRLWLHQLGQQLHLAVEPPPQQASSAADQAQSTVLTRLLEEYYGQPLPDEEPPVLYNRMLSQLARSLRVLCHLAEEDRLPWQSMIECGMQNMNLVDENMRKAANQSFDQLLRAISPEIAMQHKSKKKWQTESSYKAELFDKLREKFEHLQAYHQKGRLVRDFRSLYKMFYKQSLSE